MTTSPDDELIPIDAVAGTSIRRGDAFNELVTLSYLTHGLFALWGTIDSVERPRREQEQSQGVEIFTMGNAPGMPQGAVQAYPSFFHWYGVSIINYARLVGFLQGLASGKLKRADLADPARFEVVSNVCKSYVSGIPELQPVLQWRNKVMAHFAITDPRKDDNLATLEASVMYPVGYDRGRYKVGVGRISIFDGTTNHTSALQPWSLSEVHEAMAARYWPKELAAMRARKSTVDTSQSASPGG